MSSRFDKSTKEAYELYAQGKNSQAFSLLEPGSTHFHYLQLLEELKKGEGNLTEEFKDLFEKSQDPKKSKLNAEQLQSVVDSVIRMGKFDYLRKVVKDNTRLSFDHQKPYYADDKANKAKEDRGKNTWNQAEYFSEERTLKSVYKNPQSLSLLHKTLWNKLDFNKFTDAKFEEILSSTSFLNTLTTPSFVDKFCKFLTHKYEEKGKGNLYTIPSNYLSGLTLEQMRKIGEK